jgi:hypothetical protein
VARASAAGAASALLPAEAASASSAELASTAASLAPCAIQQMPYARVCDTDPFLIAELETLGLLPSSHAVSLTWWCRGMADAVIRQPQILMLGDYPSGGRPVASTTTPVETSADVSRAVTSTELLRLEAAVAEKAALVDQLREQLEQSSACCETLLDTVKEQESTIGNYIAARPRADPTHAVK